MSSSMIRAESTKENKDRMRFNTIAVIIAIETNAASPESAYKVTAVHDVDWTSVYRKNRSKYKNTM